MFLIPILVQTLLPLLLFLLVPYLFPWVILMFLISPLFPLISLMSILINLMFPLVILLLLSILHLLLLLLPFHLLENPLGFLIGLLICKLISAIKCLKFHLVLLTLYPLTCLPTNCLLDTCIFVMPFPQLRSPNSITKQLKIPSGERLWQLRFLPLKLITLGPS